MKFASIFCSLLFVAASSVASFAQTGQQAAPQGNPTGATPAPSDTANQARTKIALANIEKAISVLIPGGLTAGTPRQVKMASVIDMFSRGRVPEAMTELERMVGEDPQLPPAELMMAGLSFAVGDSKSGVALLESSAIKHPEYPGVYLSFAQIALNAKRITDASLHADKASQLAQTGNLSPEKKNHFLKQFYEIKTGIYLRRKQDQQAHDALNQLQVISPNLPFYFFSKAELAFRGEENHQALRFLEEHAKSIESDRLPELTLVDWLKTTNKSQQAETLLLETLSKNPDNALTQLMAARMFMGKEEYPKALLSLKRFEELNGEQTNSSLDLRARIEFAGGAYESAAELFRELNKRAPNDPSSANIYALCLIESTDPEKQKQAQQISEQVASRLQNNPLALASLAYIYTKNGEKDRAQRLMGSVALSRRATPEISYFLSYWLNENGQSEQAVEILKQAINSKGLFLYRSASRKLLANIQSK